MTSLEEQVEDAERWKMVATRMTDLVRRIEATEDLEQVRVLCLERFRIYDKSDFDLIES